METRISSIMQKHVISVAMEDTIDKVEDILNINKFSSLPVVDANGGCFGIISSPDIVRFHAAKQNPKVVRAWEICSYKPIEVGPEISVIDAARLMVQKNIHHLVITENKTIKGFVSTLDLIEKYFLKKCT